MREKIRLYGWLALVNLFISTFTFGGGYVVVPMVRKYFVHKRQLFTEEDLLEMAAIAQSTPGAIAVNLVGLAGWRVAGGTGLILSCICAILPPLGILGVISACYSAFIANQAVAAVLKGMQAGAAALIVDYLVDMTRLLVKERSPLLGILAGASFLLSLFTDINVIVLLLTSCLVCLGWVWLKKGGNR